MGRVPPTSDALVGTALYATDFPLYFHFFGLHMSRQVVEADLVFWQLKWRGVARSYILGPRIDPPSVVIHIPILSTSPASHLPLHSRRLRQTPPKARRRGQTEPEQRPQERHHRHHCLGRHTSIPTSVIGGQGLRQCPGNRHLLCGVGFVFGIGAICGQT